MKTIVGLCMIETCPRLPLIYLFSGLISVHRRYVNVKHSQYRFDFRFTFKGNFHFVHHWNRLEFQCVKCVTTMKACNGERG